MADPEGVWGFAQLFKFCFVCLFDLILYVLSTIFQLYRDGSTWVEAVLIKDCSMADAFFFDLC